MNVFPPLPGAEQRRRSLPRPPLRVLSLLGAAVLLLWLKSASERGHATSPALVVLLALIGSYGAVTVVGGHRLRAIAAWRGWPSLAAVRSWTWTPLAAVLTLQSVAALSLRNTAFQDEANYLYVGHEYIRMWQGGPAPVEPFDKYVSGVAYFYPVLAGALDLVGGLALVRLFSLACMATATACVYLIAKRLFGDDAGLLGAVAFAIQGPVLFLSHLATYDA